jgi:hypothetical protein
MRASEPVARAKVRELAAHRRATDLREEAAKLQERIRHSELLKRLGSERHAEALREQAEAEKHIP